MLEFAEYESEKKPLVTVIWLHGLGSDGDDFKALIPELELPADFPIRFIFPHAPLRQVTISDHAVLRAWYDIRCHQTLADEDEHGIRESAKQIFQLIKQERKRGIPASKIILTGFSQGGAMALFVGLRYPEKLGGIITLSGYLSLYHTLDKEMSPANRNIPIWMGHGKKDKRVPFDGGEKSRDILKEKGLEVEWHEYRMGHSVCCQELADISEHIQKIAQIPQVAEKK